MTIRHPDTDLAGVLGRNPLKGRLAQYLADLRQDELERLAVTPGEPELRIAQGRARMLADLKTLIEKL